MTLYIDLMYGFPYMNLGNYKEIVKKDIQKAIALGVDGLDFSQYYPFYNPLGETIRRDGLKFPPSKEIVETIKLGTELLEKAGYIQTTEYGFCKKGEVMLEKTYFGDEPQDCIALGPRALGYLNGFKYMNSSYFEKEIPSYILIKKLTNSEIKRIPIVTFPKLLRLNKKVLTPSLYQKYKGRLDKLKKEKLIIETPYSFELTAKGKYFINNIYLFLMEDSEIKRIRKQIKILELNKIDKSDNSIKMSPEISSSTLLYT